MFADEHACVRARAHEGWGVGERTCLRVSVIASERAGVPACVRARVCDCMGACVRACVVVWVRACVHMSTAFRVSPGGRVTNGRTILCMK